MADKWEETHWQQILGFTDGLRFPQGNLADGDHEVLLALQNEVVGHQEAEGQVEFAAERGGLRTEAACVEFVAHRHSKLRCADVESTSQATVALADLD